MTGTRRHFISADPERAERVMKMRPLERDNAKSPPRTRLPKDILHELAQLNDPTIGQILRFQNWLNSSPEAAFQVAQELAATVEELRSELNKIRPMQEKYEAYMAGKQVELMDTKNQLRTVTHELEQARILLRSAEQTTDRSQSELTALIVLRESLRTENDQLNTQLSASTTREANLRLRLEQAETELQSARQRMAEQIANQPSRAELEHQLAMANAALAELRQEYQPTNSPGYNQARQAAIELLAPYTERAQGLYLFAGYPIERHGLTHAAWQRAAKLRGPAAAQHHWLEASFYDVLLFISTLTALSTKTSVSDLGIFLQSLLPAELSHNRRIVSHPALALHAGLTEAGILRNGYFHADSIEPYISSLL